MLASLRELGLLTANDKHIGVWNRRVMPAIQRWAYSYRRPPQFCHVVSLDFPVLGFVDVFYTVKWAKLTIYFVSPTTLQCLYDTFIILVAIMRQVKRIGVCFRMCSNKCKCKQKCYRKIFNHGSSSFLKYPDVELQRYKSQESPANFMRVA